MGWHVDVADNDPAFWVASPYVVLGYATRSMIGFGDHRSGVHLQSPTAPRGTNPSLNAFQLLQLQSFRLSVHYLFYLIYWCYGVTSFALALQLNQTHSTLSLNLNLFYSF